MLMNKQGQRKNVFSIYSHWSGFQQLSEAMSEASVGTNPQQLGPAALRSHVHRLEPRSSS